MCSSDLHLGERCSGIAGLIAMAPALQMSDRFRFLLPIAKHFIASTAKSKDVHLSVQDAASASLIWSYDRNPLRFADELVALMHEVRDHLDRLALPILVFHGEHDRSVPVSASELIAKRAPKSDVELVRLADSGHCLSIDGEREQVFAKSWQWIQEQLEKA